jgi:eukaryotic-like serine/threonine-protein kinase
VTTVSDDVDSGERATDTLPSPDEAPPSKPEAKDDGEGRFDIGDVAAERYEILSRLGTGVSGTVYKARDLYVDSGHEIVALKAIHDKLHSDRQIKGRFKREAAILRRLEGRHLCRLLECVDEEGLLLLAIEYVDGPSLDEYIRRFGPLPIEEAIAIMRQICAGLASAHSGDVIHRDLKPSNVLIEGMQRERDPDDPPASFLGELRVRLVDFGLAKMVTGEATGTVLTEQDMVFGTPDYMAPEQVSGDELDARCDIYAAGVILFELLVGRVPYDTPSPLATMTAHINEPIPSARATAPSRGVSRDLDALLKRALSKKPDDRFAGAEEFAEALVSVSLEDSPDTFDEEELDVADTRLDHSEDNIGTTLRSEKSAALEASKARGAKVRVVVKDAEPASRSSSAPSSKITADDGENRMWIALAIVAGLVAIVAGLWMGSQ